MVPTSLPRLQVTINGQGLSESGMLVGVRIDQRLNMPAACELTLEPQSKAGFLLGKPGERIELRVGGPDERLLFAGEVCAREVIHAAKAAPRVVVRAYDGLIELVRAQRVRAHVGVTPADLLEELAGEAGLRVSSDERGPVFAHLLQAHQTNLALCADICARAGLYFHLAENTLELFPLSRSEPAWKPVHDDDVLRLESTESNTAAPTIKAWGWHPRSDEIFSAETNAAVATRGERLMTSHHVDDAPQTRAAVRGVAERNAARCSQMLALCTGDARLRPGVRVFFPHHAGVADDGYLVCRAIHRFSTETGYVTEISSEPPSPPESAPGSAIVLGIVSQIDAARFVAKVRLPAMDNIESDWMKVVSPGGGPKTGLLLMPHLEDPVLVLCAENDPGRGIIVGGLIADRGPNLDTHGDELPFQLRTRNGIKLELSDETKTLRFEDARGSRVVLDPNGIEVLARGDLQIRAPGKTITIAAARIDFKKAEGEA